MAHGAGVLNRVRAHRLWCDVCWKYSTSVFSRWLRLYSVVGTDTLPTACMGASHHQSALQPVFTNPYLPSTRFELLGCNPSKQLHTSRVAVSLSPRLASALNVPRLAPVLTPEPANGVIAAGPTPSTGVLVSVLPVLGSAPAGFLARAGLLMPTGAILTLWPV